MTLEGLSDGLLEEPILQFYSDRLVSIDAFHAFTKPAFDERVVLGAIAFCKSMTKDIARTPLSSFLRAPFACASTNLASFTTTPLRCSTHSFCVDVIDVIVTSIVCVSRVAVQLSATPGRNHLQLNPNYEAVCAQPASLNKRDGSEERNANSHIAGSYVVACTAARLTSLLSPLLLAGSIFSNR
jgi:hypothetical protein